MSVDLAAARHESWQAALDEPVADAALTTRELEVRHLVRDIVAREIVPRSAHADASGTFVHESVQALARAGLCGLTFPEELGGSGDTHVAYAVAMEEITAGCAATSLVYMTQMHAAFPILAAGAEALAKRYVPRLLDASAYGSLAITEPAAGSDVASLRTTAVRSDDGRTYRINGSKTFITTGDRSGVIICFASTDRSAGRKGISAFVIDGEWAGVRRGALFAKMGMHGSTTSELFLDDVEAPADHLLGDEGQGWSLLMRSVVTSRISAAAQGVGLARAAYDLALRALATRHDGRLPATDSSALATMRGQILQGRLLLHAVARDVDRLGEVPAGHIGMMKQACTDLGWRVSVDAAGLLGADGDLVSAGVERCIRDAKVTQIYDGTNEVQRLLIGRDTSRRIEDLT